MGRCESWERQHIYLGPQFRGEEPYEMIELNQIYTGHKTVISAARISDTLLLIGNISPNSLNSGHISNCLTYVKIRVWAG